jgi:hypothetical protein
VVFGLSTGRRWASRLLSGLRVGFALLLVAPFLVVQLFAQGDSGSSGKSDQDKYTLRGIILNSVTGEPVPRALVEIFAAGQRAALTDAQGHFEFSGLTPAQGIAVGVRKPGFFSEEQIQHKNGWTPPATFAVGPDAPAVVVKLFPEGLIVGRITSNGEPVEDVPVRVLTSEIQDGRRQWTQVGGGVSDEEGGLRIAGLPPGEYYLEVGPKSPAGVGDSQGHQSGYGKVFYPNAPELDSATPLLLATGQRVEADLSLKLEPWYRVSGVVKTTDPTVNLTLQLAGAGEGGEGFRLNRETGEFETRAPAGNYRLEVQGFGPKGVTGSADLPVTVNSDVSGLQVALGPSPLIPVQVKTEAT